MSRRFVVGIITFLITIVLLELLLIRFLDLNERWQFLQQPAFFPLLLLTNLILVPALWFLGRIPNRHLARWFTHLSVRAKLMWSFGFFATVPVILLVLLAYWVTSKSIEKWANEKTALALEEADKVSAALEYFHIDAMADIADFFATDETLQRRLESGRSVASIASKLASGLDQYHMGVYRYDGRVVYRTDPLFVPDHLEALSIRLEMLRDRVPITGYRDIAQYGVLSCTMPIFSEWQALETPIGAVVILRPLPFTIAEREAISKKVKEIQTKIGEGQISYQELQKFRPRARRLLVLILVLASVTILVVVLWVSAYLSKSISVPINLLVEGTRHVARGDLDYQVHLESQDEFAVLANSFNQMIKDLDRAVEERKRAEQLAVWRDAARKLAHEIKNPLTPIQLSAERLQRRYHNNPEGFEELLETCTQTILREVESARRWLDEFSQLGRMPTPESAPVDVCQVLRQALDAVSDWPPEIRCETYWPEEGVTMDADGEQLRRAFFNLIKNALESMEEEGILSVRVNQNPEESNVVIEICDTGSGVPPEVLPKLFVPHFSTKRDGMGLGLAIVKKIIDDHRGNIEVKTGERQRGACFIITLPTGET